MIYGSQLSGEIEHWLGPEDESLRYLCRCWIAAVITETGHQMGWNELPPENI
jgi:hypothetical protein